MSRVDEYVVTQRYLWKIALYTLRVVRHTSDCATLTSFSLCYFLGWGLPHIMTPKCKSDIFMAEIMTLCKLCTECESRLTVNIELCRIIRTEVRHKPRTRCPRFRSRLEEMVDKV